MPRSASLRVLSVLTVALVGLLAAGARSPGAQPLGGVDMQLRDQIMARIHPATEVVVHEAPLLVQAGDLHRFTFVDGPIPSMAAHGTIDGVITDVRNQIVYLWQLNAKAAYASADMMGVPFEEISPADRAYCEQWAKAHPPDQPPPARPPGAQELAMAGLSSFSHRLLLVDMDGALRGKTVTMTANGFGHYLALCSDGTVVAWGVNEGGQLGDGRRGAAAFSAVPVRVDTTGVLKGRKVVAIGADHAASFALCSDGTLCYWGFLGGGDPASARDSPTLFAPKTLQGHPVAAIARPTADTLMLCADGTLLGLDPAATNQVRYNTLPLVALNRQGVLKGKTIAAMATADDHSVVACTDGTLAQCGPCGIPGVYAAGAAVDGVKLPPNPVRIGWDAKVEGKFSDKFVRLVDTTGTLAGKTPTAVATDGSISSLVLYADGTLAAWGGFLYADYNMEASFIKQFSNRLKSKDAREQATVVVRQELAQLPSAYPLLLNVAGALHGRTITGIALGPDAEGEQGYHIFLSDGSLLHWNIVHNQAIIIEADPFPSLKGKFFQAVTGYPNTGPLSALVLYREPAAPAETTQP